MESSGTHKVLVIDDEMQMRFYLTALVKSLGYEAIQAKDGEQGLEALKTVRPSVIILDIMMPKKGGARVYRELVSTPGYRNIPVVFFSGVDKAAFYHYIRMLNAGLDQKVPEPENYVVKDADPEYLKQVIQDCIRQGKEKKV